ncbi:MAG: zinc transporter ZupT [Brevibacterium yomogidense]|uniref:Zinc transporter ZupT n=1 Tax=Brevibacterium yomogidense TaxID=946573 RepID=A0A1X6XM02_9MICO|nr:MULTISPECIES: zinc transporter ZupT [Brevibacterium]SLN00029.1 Zinc transporter ZupT [Brevibacterium yomogidense]SMX75781.1 zinc transporter, ZIP family [Brevibacterium sp. Mu109]
MAPLIALSLSIIAGLATGLGGLIAVFGGGMSKRFLAAALGFAAGVMVCISLVELIPDAAIDLRAAGVTPWMALVAALIGAVVVLLFSAAARFRNRAELPASTDALQKRALLRTGVLTAIVITVHNFPEGFATFLTALHDPYLALPVVAAIALHNVPEGIAVAVPIHHATGSRKRALWASVGSGLAEPAGAVIGWLLLAPLLTPVVLAAVLAGVAGVMITISVAELLPAAIAQKEKRTVIAGIASGVVVMWVSLQLLT